MLAPARSRGHWKHRIGGGYQGMMGARGFCERRDGRKGAHKQGKNGLLGPSS
jgi:hypothetical protein